MLKFFYLHSGTLNSPDVSKPSYGWWPTTLATSQNCKKKRKKTLNRTDMMFVNFAWLMISSLVLRTWIMMIHTCMLIVWNHLTSTFNTSNVPKFYLWFQEYKIWCFFGSPFVFQLQLVWIRIKTYLSRAPLVSFFVEDFVNVDE